LYYILLIMFYLIAYASTSIYVLLLK
jgi:hypothetical protein